ncbi:MAG: glycosyltransferase [Desulfobulbaceae bacterium]|nr:glycosyltransferase [Desulfobulbaceae bacterium]
MRIAFLINSFPALSETFILNQITGILDRGHDVDIFPIRKGNLEEVHHDIVRYELLKHTHFCTVPPEHALPRIFGSLQILASHFLTRPVLSSTFFPQHCDKRPGLLSFPYELTPFKERGDYDIIHCHYGSNGLRGALYRHIGILKGKLFVTFHGFDITEYFKLHGEHVYDSLFQRADLFLPVSDNWHAQLIAKGCPPEKIKTHHMGIDCRKFRFTPRFFPEKGPVRFITVARLVEKKGIEYAIQAFARVVSKQPDVEYHIVGDGPLRPGLEDLITKLDLSERVKLAGWKSQEELLSLLNSSHIMLAPSVTGSGGDQEGIPVALMEAMALGIPVIATHHSGIPELIHDGKSGLLAPERDEQILAEKMSYMLDHHEKWHEMGSYGRSSVEKHYNIKTLNNELVQLFEHYSVQG